MKKLILLLLIIPNLTFGQAARVWKRCGVPSTVSSITGFKAYDILADTCGMKFYKVVGTKFVEDTKLDQMFGDGSSSTPGPQGPVGPQGPAGQNGICPACPPSGGGGVFPFIVVIGTGGDDTPEIQRAVDSAYVTGQTIFLCGELNMASGVEIPDDIKYLHITGGAILWATNNNTWTYFYKPTPSNVSDAEGVYTNGMIIFSNLKLRGWNSGADQKQTGIDLMAGENIQIINVKGFNLKRFVDASFHLKFHSLDCEANACIDGMIIRSGYGRYTGATLENASSNTCTVDNFRSVGSAWTNIGLGIYDVSLPKVDGLTIEGSYHNIGYDHNSTASTSQGINLYRLHFECTNPCGIATVRITSSTMNHVIDNPNHIKPGIFVKVVPIGGGYPTVLIRNVSNQRVLHNDVNPILQSANGVGWRFENCDSPLVPAKMATIFTGAVMTNACNRSSGLSRWCIVNPPN